MSKYLILWRVNPAAPWPLEPQKSLELQEKIWAVMDDSMKRGLTKEYGIFPDGNAGYLIGEGDATNMLRGASMFMPFVISEVHEIISYEKQKEILRDVIKLQSAAMK